MQRNSVHLKSGASRRTLAVTAGLLGLLLALLTLPVAVSVFAQGEPPKPAINQDRVIGEGETVDGDVTVTNGNLTVYGKVTGDVVVVNGNAVISGSVLGSVSVLFAGSVTLNSGGSVDGDVLSNGDVVLRRGSSVDGDVRVIGGKAIREPSAHVGGEISAPLVTSSGVLTQALPNRALATNDIRAWAPSGSFVDRVVMLFADGVLSILLLGAGVLFVALAPNRVRLSGGTLEAEPGPSIVLGAIFAVLLFPLSLLLGMLLAVSVIGLPLVPVLALAVILLLLFGLVTLSMALGRWILGTMQHKHSSLVLQVLTGMSIVLGSTLLPAAIRPGIVSYLMLGLLYFAMCVGLGAVMLSRFGKLAPLGATPQGYTPALSSSPSAPGADASRLDTQ